MNRDGLWLAAIVAAAALLFLARLGATDFWTPDEPRYGQIAEELRSGEHGARGVVLLHINGEAYTQKPPLYYWLAAAAGAPAGRVSEALARLPSALAGVATVALVIVFGRRLFGRALPGLFAGALLLTIFRFAHTARRAQLDVLLTLFEALALFAYWRLATGRDGPDARRGAWLVALHGAMGLAALTKGPVGWIPLLVIAVHLACEGRLREWRRFVPVWGWALSIGPLLAWLAAATWLAPEGFFEEAVVANLFDRAVGGTFHVRPFYYFAYQLPADLLPWTLLLPLVAVEGARVVRARDPERSAWLLLAAWALVPLLVFSFSAGKRGLYLLPTMPAWALLCGAALDRAVALRGRTPPWLRAALGLTGAAILIAGSWLALEGGLDLADAPGFRVASRDAALVAAMAGAGCAGGIWLWRLGHPAPAIVAALVTAMGIELAVFTLSFPVFDAEKSPRPIALLAAALTEPDEPVGIFDDTGLTGGIVYYSGRRVATLPRPRHVRRFLDEGGRRILLERWKLPWLAEVGPLEVVASTRSGRRETVIVSPPGAVP